jgi:hypothetical protein
MDYLPDTVRFRFVLTVRTMNAADGRAQMAAEPPVSTH